MVLFEAFHQDGEQTPMRFILVGAIMIGAVSSVNAQQNPHDFREIRTVSPEIVVEERYATAHNFVGKPVDGYQANKCYLTASAAEALSRVQIDLRRDGLGLKVFDCYRPKRAVAHFVRWAQGDGSSSMKAEFYPTIDRSRLFALGYIGRQSGHSRGSTVDLTIVDQSGKELDMGTPFDYFGPASGCCNGSSSNSNQNRLKLRKTMTANGFAPYNKEWWHFTLRNEPYPSTYFDFVVR